jgi:hypothetical protein
MAEHKDWLPHNHQKLLAKGVLIYDYITATGNRDRMGFATATPQGIWFDNNYGPNLTYLENAYKAWEDPATRTKILTADLKAREKVFIPIIRKLYKSFLKDSPLVTDHDLAAMELPPRTDGSRTPVPLPTSLPIPTRIDSISRRLTIRYVDSKTGKRGRPDYVRGAAIFWQVFTEEQKDIPLKNLVHTKFNNVSPFIINFTDEDRGKYFYFAMQWVNTETKGGPVGDVFHKIIS